ncbi:MAG TPA: MFS transporter [Planctomycetota bacterium]|nr:MFS transporter [Planctomycetota bacterium]
MKAAPHRLLDVRRGELGIVIGAALFFFFLLTLNYILRAVRDAVGSNAPEDLPKLYTGTLVTTLVLSPLFGWLVVHVPRRQFIAIAYRVFALTLVGFYFWMHGEEAGQFGGKAFFVWFSACNLLIVSVFWGFLADILVNEQAKRLYGLIGAGGTLGAIVGSKFTSWLMKLPDHPDPVMLLVYSALLLEICVQIMQWIGRRAPPVPKPVAVSEPERPNAWSGMQLVAKKPYLRILCVYMLLQTICATFLYNQQSYMAKAHFDTSAARTAFSADISFWSNTLSLCLQLCFTGALLQGLGVRRMLLPLPIIAAIGFFVLGLDESIVMFQVAVVLSKSCEYATGKPARETLYTVVSRAEKYQAKSFIDTFIYRGGDWIGAWAFDALKVTLQYSLGTIAWIAVPLATTWAFVAHSLGRKQEALAKAAVSLETPRGPG